MAPCPALAQSAPMLFDRADIVIHPTNTPSRQGEVTIIRPALNFNVEVRSEDALKLDYIHTLNMLSDSTGVMIVFDQPSKISLPAMQVFTPVDVLFVAGDGTIVEIFPGAILGNITQKIIAPTPIKAFLFLKNATVAAHAIKPRDVISGPMFTPPLTVQE